MHCLYISSRACLIDFGDTFVITGGYPGTSTVTHYNSSGHLGDLAPLNTGRYYHGCSSYTDSSQQQVRVAHGYTPTGTDHVQVLLVAGGYAGEHRRFSTEILVTLAGVWRTVGQLPTAVFGLRGATLDNTVYMLGEWYIDIFIV